MRQIKDDFGQTINEGDTVSFSYGIPPVGVKAKIISENGRLIAVVPEPHKPERCNLSYLKKWFNIYKETETC
jgi:hypothetical protein